jgi:hypothetical protein
MGINVRNFDILRPALDLCVPTDQDGRVKQYTKALKNLGELHAGIT